MSWSRTIGRFPRRINASQHFRSFWAAWRTKSRLRGDPHDSQRPSELGRSVCEARSTAKLHSRSVRRDELNFRPSTPIFGSTAKLQHIQLVGERLPCRHNLENAI